MHVFGLAEPVLCTNGSAEANVTWKSKNPLDSPSIFVFGCNQWVKYHLPFAFLLCKTFWPPFVLKRAKKPKVLFLLMVDGW